jgi:hypothetical protein
VKSPGLLRTAARTYLFAQANPPRVAAAVKRLSKAERALRKLEALAKAVAAERAARPPPPAPRPPPPPKPAIKPPPKPATKPSPKPATTLGALGGSGTTAEKMRALANAAAGSAPCLLSAEELAKGMPSEHTLRYWRRAQEPTC